MKRQPHYLKHNVKSESPRQCIFFDTETSDIQVNETTKHLELKFGMACYTRMLKTGKWSVGEWQEFDRSASFWWWVLSKARKKTKLFVFAHNLVFDLTVTHGFTILKELGCKLTKAIIDDPPTILQFRLDQASICLVDTFNYFKGSLADLGKSIGLDKLDMPLESDYSASWQVYCRRDVEIIKEAMLKYLAFIKDNDLGNFQLTAASQAFTAYRHRFMTVPIFIDNNEKALSMARDSYHGGRTEAFYIGEKTGDFYLLDVNSMYPFVMSVHPYPVSLIGVYHRVSFADLAAWIAWDAVIADVTLKTPEPCFAVKTKDRLLFPTGTFRTTLTTPEVAYALDNGYMDKIHRVSVYHHANIFEKYVHELYKLRSQYREANQPAFEFLCKLLLNSLYGKFGQAGRVYQDIGETPSEDIKSWTEWDADSHEITKFRQFSGIIQSMTKETESFNSHPAISAHVCAYARMWLWKLINQAGKKNVYYCDTDSLVVNEDGYNQLYMMYAGDGLGEIKLVKRFTHLVIHGAKDYAFDDLVRIKGISKKAIKTDINTYYQDKFTKFRGLVKSGDLDTMTVVNQRKILSRQYNKGKVLEDGRVEPIVTQGDPDYELWLEKRYEPKYVRLGVLPEDTVDPRYRAQRDIEKLSKKRSRSRFA